MATFSELFCQRHHIAPERFVRAMFWRCLHRRTWIFVPFIRLVDDDYFSADYDLIRGVGRITKASDLADELADFYSHPRNHTFARRRLGLRVSVGRLSHIVHEVLPGRSRRLDPNTRAPFAG
ncbi:MAG: hypothetical protein HY736_20600 [Verrucomicrobia bacterium]|nr:hypothetical protein [Verrucomicrobiota bacterium]